MHRFYIPPSQWNPGNLRLEVAEAKHCTEVLRLESGARIAVFNGKGAETTAEIVDCDRQSVTLKSLHSATTPPLRSKLTLAQAIPKGRNMDFIVQKATELGTAVIAPVLSERTVIRLEEGSRNRKSVKWGRVAIEAAKQCGRNWLPEVLPPRRLDETLDELPPHDLMLIASLQGDTWTIGGALEEYAAQHGGSQPESVLVLVGPEGDFTPAEMSLARSRGCTPVTLGPIVLRSETAALYCLSVLGNRLF